MRVQIMGTAAAEGFPALFCRCESCARAREKGGRNLRSRAGTLVDNRLMIDYSADTLMHMQHCNADFMDVDTLLVTHDHEDHFYVDEFFARKPGFTACYDTLKPLTVIGNEACGHKLERSAADTAAGKMDFSLIQPGQVMDREDYIITACPARHDAAQKCMLYLIESQGKSLFYGHDSGYYLEETWAMLQGKHLDLVMLDCTCGRLSGGMTGGHMGFPENLKVKERMLRDGIADERTTFCVTHFSHNGHADYDDMVALAVPEGFVVAYDGVVFDL